MDQDYTNPIIQPTGYPENVNAFGSTLIVDGVYHHYYTRATQPLYYIDHATSPDGIVWTKDTAHNPVLAPGTADWEDQMVYVPMVWKEGLTWYMIYTGRGVQNYSGGTLVGGYQKLGLATSTDGLTWTRSPSNPIMVPTKAWEINGGNTVENFGVMKVGSTYYMAYQVQWYSEAIAYSTDLIHWTLPNCTSMDRWKVLW